MNYYNNFININTNTNNDLSSYKYEYGILEKNNDIFYVNNKEVENNRALINDIVYVYENKIVQIKERSKCIISGILYLNSKMKYGIKNKKQIYLFKPNNKKYSTFYLCSSCNLNTQVYCIIEFKSWEINEKQPFGNIIEIFGKIGVIENEYKNLLYFYDIFNKTQKYDPEKIKSHKKIIDEICPSEKNYDIFCIDPKGSKDLDDGFHYNNSNDKDYIEVGVHIAYPYKFLNTENDFKLILKRVSTIYLLNNINLISSIYADNLSSFIEKNYRFSISLILKIKNNIVIDYHIEEKIVYVEKNYDYNEFDNIYKNNKNLVDFVDFSKDFFDLSAVDSHILVEKWMIYANKTIATYLINMNLSNVILRVHNDTILNLTSIPTADVTKYDNKNIDNTVIVNENLIQFLKNKNENSASYEIINKKNCQYHSKMNNEYYTHFTSPIRRCIDFFNQYLLIEKKDKYTNEELQLIINHINSYEKNLKKFYRKKSRIDFIFNKKDINEIITEGHIVEFNNNYMRLFIPEYNLDEKIFLFHYKFNKIINIEKTENSIEYIYEDQEYKYTLYEKLIIKIHILIYEENIFEKIKIEIL